MFYAPKFLNSNQGYFAFVVNESRHQSYTYQRFIVVIEDVIYSCKWKLRNTYVQKITNVYGLRRLVLKWSLRQPIIHADSLLKGQANIIEDNWKRQ